MIKIEKKYPGDLPNCSFFDTYFGSMDNYRYKIGVLDIETTGLDPKRQSLVLGGLLTYDKNNNELLLQQFFAENISEEKAVLEEYMKAVRQLSVIVTYNGKHFDLNFMKERCQKLDVNYTGKFADETAFDGLPHNLDLYLLIRGHSNLGKLLPNLKQKTVENYLGLWNSRADEISGKESVDMYYEYCNTLDSSLLEKILLHNHDDLMQLGKLLAVLPKTEMHKGMFKLGFPVGPLSVTGISIERDLLQIKGRQRDISLNYLAYPQGPGDVFCCFDADSMEFQVSVPLIRRDGLSLISASHFSFCDELSRFPNVLEGFVLTEHSGNVNYATVNAFAKLLLNDILSRMSGI